MINKIILSLICACSSNLVVVPDKVPVEVVQNLSSLPESTEETVRIYFIRNGESEYSEKDANGTKFTSGRSPAVSLNKRGIAQATNLREALASKIHNGVIYTPPALRAEQTAFLITSTEDEISIGGVAEGLFEVGMGVWEGKPKDRAYKEEYQKWKSLSAYEKYTAPRVTTGESYYDASERALKELNGIVDREQGRTIFVVSGENLLNALALRWTGAELSRDPGSDLPMLPMKQCDFYMVEFSRGQPVETAKLKFLIHVEKVDSDNEINL